MNVIGIRETRKSPGNQFDSVQFISTVGGLLIDIAVNDAVGNKNCTDALYADLYLFLAKSAAEIIRDQSWDYTVFLSYYPDLKSVFEDAEREYAELSDEVGCERVTVYCPFGCMKVDLKKSEPARNCTHCGEEMSAEYGSFLNDLVLSA